MKLYICTTIQQEKATGGGGAKIRTAIFFISCCNIAPHLWLSFLKTILVITNFTNLAFTNLQQIQ